MALPKKTPRGWYRVTVSCPLCDDGELDVLFFPGNKGRTYGPPERCFPPDPPEIEVEDSCPECGEEIGEEHYDDILEEAEEKTSDYR